MEEYARVNREFWDERVPAHVASTDYGVARFAEDPAFLSDVVRFDVPRLGDLTGVEGVHLQCHIGTDTVSLTRLGARMTGLDISPPALAEARRLAEAAGADATFVESEVYSAVEALGPGRFDLVYTGVGALCWLPDIRRWAAVVAELLRPGGRLHVRDGHPMLWAIADAREDRLLVVEHPYFETAEATVWDEGDEGTTYVDTDVVFKKNVTHEWNHGLAQIITALMDAGMELTLFEEHDTVPWDALPGQMTDTGGGEMRLTDRPQRLPCTYTIQARKSG